MAKLELLGEMKVGDKPALGVRVEVKGYRGVSLFFDKETHLLVKSESRGKDVIGGGEEFTNEKLYSDYKKIGEVSAHWVAIKRDSENGLTANSQNTRWSRRSMRRSSPSRNVVRRQLSVAKRTGN